MPPQAQLPARPAVPSSPAAPAGVVSINRYWVNQTVAQNGRTVALGYVINNPTGHPIRVLLGASLKSSQALSWSQQALNDPSHDVVAVVPPGVTTHVRYFTVPSGLRPGAYDVAWGLRSAASGRRNSLVAAPRVLHVVR